MDEFSPSFEVLPQHRILVCHRCQFAVVPSQIETHLRVGHKRLSLDQRRSIIARVAAITDLAQIEADVIYPTPSDPPVAGLPIYFDGLKCDARSADGTKCRYICRTARNIRKHCEQQHGWTNQQKRGGNARSKKVHADNKIWSCHRACQQLFKAGSWKRYFEIDCRNAQAPTQDRADRKHDFFRNQEEDMSQAQRDAAEAANRVRGFDEHRSTVVPWLRETGIVDHLRGLKKDEIRAAIAIPPPDDDGDLRRILDANEGMLREAHGWCFDGSDCMLTWPCRVVLNRFQSSRVEAMGSTRAFDPYKGSGALQDYFRVAQQALVYFDQVAASEDYFFSYEDEEETILLEDVMEPTDEQLAVWEAIRVLAREGAGAAGDEDRGARLKDLLVGFWMLLISHDTGSRRYQSPLLSFCTMLSIKPSTRGWMEPGNFNSRLSAIIWVVQLLIFYDSARRERQGEGRTLALVKRRCERHLQQTVEAPMGEILRWRLLLFRVSKDGVGDHEASWDEDEQVLTYEDTELHMHQIPTLLLSEYRACQQLLYDDLLLGRKDIRRMRSWALRDGADIDTVGWGFTQHRDNAHLLQGSDQALLTSIEHSHHLCRLFLADDGRSSSGFAWREAALAAYEGTVQGFLQRLAVLVHVSGGQPVRESEFFSMTWRNTQRRRSITLRHDRVMIHVQYHKGQQQTGRYKENIRFLPRPVGELLLDYLVYVMPLRQVFLRQQNPRALVSPFLWEQGGKVWADGQLSRCLEDASCRAGVPRLHVANWRQMTVAIVKTKFASQIGCFEAADDDEDAEEMDDAIKTMTKQRNHKTQTVNRAYANQTGASFGNVWDGLIRTNLRASTLWQDFWGVETILKVQKRGRDEEDARLTKRMAMGVYRPRKPWSSEALLEGVRQLHGDPQMGWKSPEQEHAMTTIMSWTEQVVIVLPTGAGKSLLFMLPGTLPDAGITVLVVPLVSLRGDLLRRLREMNIDHLEWLPGERREAGLMLVTAEAASSKDFMKYARSLIAQQKLDRIVVDECHLTVTAAHYRESIVDLASIRGLRTQFVYLTATLPPSMLAEFVERNYLLRPKPIRASSNRPNLFYMVRRAERGHGSLLEQAAAEAKDAWTRSTLFDPSRDKIILYVRTRDEASELAGLLDCAVYTARSGSAAEKGEIVHGWTSSAVRPYLVATTAFAEGFDYPHVRLVINVGEPESLVLFAQESGRAGRDGKRAYSLVLLPASWEAQEKPEFDEDQAPLPAARDLSLAKLRERRAVQKYLTAQQCFRTSLSEHLDSPEQRRWCMIGDVACDICQRCHEQPVGPPERTTAGRETGMDCTGTDLIQIAQRRDHAELARYREDLLAVRGSCLLCRALEERWDHHFAACHRRHSMFRERNRVRQRCEAKGRRWLQPYTACFWCLNPQSVCPRADMDAAPHGGTCEERDVVLPLCYGIFCREGGRDWLHDRFGRAFTDLANFLEWLGEECRFGDGKAIQAVRVAAEALADFHLY